VHTPRRWGLPFSAGVVFFETLSCRPLRTSCWIVGTATPLRFGLPTGLFPERALRPPRSGVSDPDGLPTSLRSRWIQVCPTGVRPEGPNCSGHRRKDYPGAGAGSKPTPDHTGSRTVASSARGKPSAPWPPVKRCDTPLAPRRQTTFRCDHWRLVSTSALE
jgi:hypothetical protein